MSQINVNAPPPVYGRERTTSSGAGMLAVVLALVVAAVVIWMLFSGMFSGAGSSSTNVNVNPPAQSQPAQKDGGTININVPKVEVNPQSQPAAPAKP